MLKKVITTTTATVLSAVMLGGCSIADFGTENLLRPPKAMGNEAAIEQIIADSTKDKYTLKYPKSGSYRSAITMTDLDGDGNDEAIAFCREGDDITSIHMLVMYSIDDEWKLSSDNITETTDIDCLDFADINGDGKREILAGFSTYTPNINLLSCYSYSEGSTSVISSGQSYSAFCCGDFNSDKDDEVITLLLFTTENEATASMLDYESDKNALITKAGVGMDPNITRFRSVAVSKLGNTNAIIIDGVLTNDELNTQIIYYSTELSLLRNPLYHDKAKSFTQRRLGVLSADVDGDSQIEIPAVEKLPYPSGESAELVANKVDWYSFSTESETTQLKTTIIADNELEFAFTVPQIWTKGSVTAQSNPDNNSIEFYEWNKDSLGSKLFEIRKFEKSDWDMGKSNDTYTLITKDDTFAYTFINEKPESKFALNDDEIKTAFTVLSNISV